MAKGILDVYWHLMPKPPPSPPLTHTDIVCDSADPAWCDCGMTTGSITVHRLPRSRRIPGHIYNAIWHARMDWVMQLNLSSFIFLRHGLTLDQRRVQGQANAGCPRFTQAQPAYPIHLVHSSDRGWISAEIIAAQIHVPVVVIDGLKEMPALACRLQPMKGVW